MAHRLIAPVAWLAVASAVIGAAPARAEPQHAIAMHGKPKHGAGFTHFDYADPEAPKGGRLVLGPVGSFDSLNPFVIKGVPAAGMNLVFERLLKRGRDEPFTLYGLIAESVEVPLDRSWVAFTLRPEARFHDGTPITADDVIFSWRTLAKQGRPNHRLFYRMVERAEKMGRRAVKFVFKRGDNWELPLILGLMPILPEAHFRTVEFERATLQPIMGSGPYRVEAVDQGRSITYRRVSAYWGRHLAVNRGQHNFDQVRYDYYRDDAVAMEAFKAGLVDVRPESDPGRWATGYTSPALDGGAMVLEKIPHGRPAGMYGFAFNTRRPLFRERRVRAALTHAFDFEWVNRTLFHGAYRRTASYFENSELAATTPPGAAERALLEPFRDGLPRAVFTQVYRPPAGAGDGENRKGLRTALRLLRQAGWVHRDGLMFDPSGAAARFEILLIRPRNERLALTLSRKLERLGIEVGVRTVDSAQYQNRLNSYDFDMILYLWDESLSPGNEQAFYWGSRAAGEEGTRNYPGIKDAAVDAMIGHIVAARRRQALIDATRALDRVLQWGHYVLPLYHLPADRLAYWNKFGRPSASPLNGYQLDTWWEDPAKAAALKNR